MSSDVLMLIHDGQVSSVSGEWLDVVNPATEEVEARVPHAGAEDVDRAVSSARDAMDQGRSSGIGADMGLESVESYTRLKSVIVNLNDTPNTWAAAS